MSRDGGGGVEVTGHRTGKPVMLRCNSAVLLIWLGLGPKTTLRG